jgi:hypothetical protein
MKTKILQFALIAGLSIMMTSCYTYTATIGKGPQTNVSVKKKNHYLIGGLAPIGVSDAKAMAGDATDYSINIQHTFVDGLINLITFGIYTPTTTTVTK